MVAMATDGLCASRCFYNIGAPDSSAHLVDPVSHLPYLAAGNAKYNGFYNGFVIAATLTAAGSSYAAGNVLTTGTTGGTATQATLITVDSVTSTGAIVDFHVSMTGVYSVYPTNPVSVTGGGGTGATFTLNQPPADFYFDMTTPGTPMQYMCITAGSNSTSTWAKISGGLNWQSPKKELDLTVAVPAGVLVYISPNNLLATSGWNDLIAGHVVVAQPGIWFSLKPVPAATTAGYNVPAVPTPGAVGGTPLAGDLDNANAFWARLDKFTTC